MPSENEIEYLALRAEVERVLSEEAQDRDAARAHAELARRYKEVIDDWIKSGLANGAQAEARAGD